MRRVVLTSIVLVVALAACRGKATEPAQQPNIPTDFRCEVAVSCKIPARVTVLPMNVNLNVGDTVRLTAYVDADSGVNTSVYWMSLLTSLAQVDKSGLVHGSAVGNDTVVATMSVGPSIQGVGALKVTSTPQPWVAIAGFAQAGTKTQAMLAVLHDSVDVLLIARPAGQTMAGLSLVITGPVDTVFSAPVVQSANEDVALRWHTEASNGTKAVFPNGVYHLAPRLTMADGSVIAPTSVQVKVANP